MYQNLAWNSFPILKTHFRHAIDVEVAKTSFILLVKVFFNIGTICRKYYFKVEKRVLDEFKAYNVHFTNQICRRTPV